MEKSERQASKKLLGTLAGEIYDTPPIWMMRQAGRYLPEYKATRHNAGSFLDLCFAPKLAEEVTLQPIRRFGFDAAILFSDILVVPYALGRNLRFEEGRGPLLDPIQPDEISKLDRSRFHDHLDPVYETVDRLSKSLPSETTLIGFCGAPWTVATYMIAGHGTPDQAPARLFRYRYPEAFQDLLLVLADQSAEYLIRQAQAGAEVLQIFDSWSGVLDEDSFALACIEPVRRMVARVREEFPQIPIIGFPKGASEFLDDYRERTGVTALGLDWTVAKSRARNLASSGTVQGNLDPLRLLAGGRALQEGTETIMSNLSGTPYIFNLGHGILPATPIENVEAMVRQLRTKR